MDILQRSSFTAIFFWQHFLWNEFVQTLKTFFSIAMEVNTLTNFFLEEGFNEIDNGINQWRCVDDMDFLQFYWIGFLKHI